MTASPGCPVNRMRLATRRRQVVLDPELTVAEVNLMNAAQQLGAPLHLRRSDSLSQHRDPIEPAQYARGQDVEADELHEADESCLGRNGIGVGFFEHLGFRVDEDRRTLVVGIIGGLHDQETAVLDDLPAFQKRADRIEHVIEHARAENEVERAGRKLAAEVLELHVRVILDVEIECVADHAEGGLVDGIGCVNFGGAQGFHAEAGDAIDCADIEHRHSVQVDASHKVHEAEQRRVLRAPGRKATAGGEVTEIDRMKPAFACEL